MIASACLMHRITPRTLIATVSSTPPCPSPPPAATGPVTPALLISASSRPWRAADRGEQLFSTSASRATSAAIASRRPPRAPPPAIAAARRPDHDHPRARRGEAQRNRLADPAAAARHHRDPAGERGRRVRRIGHRRSPQFQGANSRPGSNSGQLGLAPEDEVAHQPRDVGPDRIAAAHAAEDERVLDPGVGAGRAR
jgi:hypothetical protein